MAKKVSRVLATDSSWKSKSCTSIGPALGAAGVKHYALL